MHMIPLPQAQLETFSNLVNVSEFITSQVTSVSWEVLHGQSFLRTLGL